MDRRITDVKDNGYSWTLPDDSITAEDCDEVYEKEVVKNPEKSS